MFKVGNKVKIIGVAKGHESDKDFNSYVGREGVVVELIDKKGYWPIRVQFKESEDYQGFHDYCLELIQETKKIVFKIGDKVKVVGLTKNGDNPEYLKTLGMTGLIIGKAFAYEWRVAFQDPVNDWFAYDEEQLIKEGELPMPAKFKIGDTVKVTASKEELGKINALGAFGLEGKVIETHPVCFVFRHSGDAWWNLNYAHAELVKEKTEPKFKAGDLVRWGDLVCEIERLEKDGVVIYEQIYKYNNLRSCTRVLESELELVTELKVGDRVVLPPSVVEIVGVEEYKKKDYLYRVKTELGIKQYLSNELMPKGACAIPEKFEIGEVVLYKDSNSEGVGLVKSDDKSQSYRYLIAMSKDNKKCFSGNELTKIPQDMFPELRNILKEK